MESQYCFESQHVGMELVGKIVRFIGHPYLVDHHNGKEIADCREEETVKVMLCIVANAVAKDVEDHLANDEEENTKGNVAERPSILKGVCHQDDLHDHVYEQADAVDQI